MKRYNVVQIAGEYYVNDPDTMTLAPFPTMSLAEVTSRALNSGEWSRDDYFWANEPV